MFKSERILSLLDRIEDAITLIDEKSSYIKSADDFLYSSDGMFVLSGICMQLIFIGESAKVNAAKLLQKSEMRKDIVIELSYKGFG